MIRSKEHVRRCEQLGDAVDREKLIDKPDVAFDVVGPNKFGYSVPVALAVASTYLRMRLSCNDENRVGPLTNNCRQRFDRQLKSLARRNETERRENEFVFDAEGLACLVAVGGINCVGRAVRHDFDLFRTSNSLIDEKMFCGWRKDRHDRRKAAGSSQDVALVRTERRKNRM